MGLMKELNDLNNIYQKMYDQEVSEDQDKGYVVTAADKKGNTKAWQGYKKGVKSKKTGKPLYRAADHLKNEGYEEKKKEEVLGAMKKQGRKLSDKEKNKIANKVVKDKGDTSKSDDRYAYEEVSPEVEKLIESGLFSDAEIAKIADIQEADIADIIARLEKKRISKGGDPEESPLPAMRKYHADKKKKKVTVVMKANIDETRLNIEIKKNSKVFSTSSDDKSKLAMVFFSRTVDAQRTYDERVSKKTKSTTGVDINEEETDTGITSSTTETSSTETGGSKLKKADVSVYKVDDNDTVKIEAAMKEIFTKARFEPMSGKRLVRKKWRELRQEIVDSLESGGSIPEEARWDIEDILIEKRINYVVFAYFDVGVPETDPSTGSQMIAVALNYAEIMNLGSSDPVSLGTISGIQMKGKGNNNDIAKNNAIAAASKETGKRIVALINSKGLN